MLLLFIKKNILYKLYVIPLMVINMKTKYLYIDIYNDIAKKIENGKFEYNELLPTIKQFAKIYNVSEITIKKSFQKLKEQNYINSKSGTGTFVTFTEFENNTKEIYSLIIPDFSEVFCLEIVNTFEKICRSKNVIPLISRTFGSTKLENQIIEEHLMLDTQAIIIMPVHDESINHTLNSLTKKNFPLVSIDREFYHLPIPSVSTNNAGASRMLANYLKDNLKYSPIIVSPNFSNSSVLSERLQVFINEFERYTILHNNNFLPSLKDKDSFMDFEKKELKQYFENQINKGFDCIFCVEYNIANEIYKFLNEYNIDLEIVCFDYPAGRSQFKFTHVLQNQKDITRQALEIIEKQLSYKQVISSIKIDAILIYKNI